MVDHYWIEDRLHAFYRIRLACRALLVDEQTPCQHLQVVDTEVFGRVLLLDGVFQLTELDHAGYHELIAHVPLLAHSWPRRVLIVGGGDGGTLSQVLRYESVERVVVCELDRRVVEVCRQYFPELARGFTDPRVELVVADACDYLASPGGRFDVIIADTTDPVGEAEKLFSERFYRLMFAALQARGVIVTQCEHMYFDAPLIRRLLTFGRTIFARPAYYHTLVPSYPGGGIGFLYLSDVPWRDGLERSYPGPMRYLNRAVHEAAFALPEFLREQLAAPPLAART